MSWFIRDLSDNCFYFLFFILFFFLVIIIFNHISAFLCLALALISKQEQLQMTKDKL